MLLVFRLETVAIVSESYEREEYSLSQTIVHCIHKLVVILKVFHPILSIVMEYHFSDVCSYFAFAPRRGFVD